MGILDLINGAPPKGLGDYLCAGILSALTPLYRSGAFLHKKMYLKKIKKTQKLPCRVVCIGNLTLGGSGKTPVTMMAARLLSEAGKKVVILSRGYKRLSKDKKMILVSDNQKTLSNPKEAGDEPYMMALSLPGIPVIVGADRILTGQYAIKNFQPDIILLDDGFQHWRLERDCDIVCIDSQKPLDKLRLFPRGALRETLDGLKRAQAVILTRTENAIRMKEQEDLIRRIAGQIPILKMRYNLGEAVPMSDIETEEITPDILQRKRVLLFCGLANPDSFFKLAEKQFRHVEKKIAFPDHVSYTNDQLREIKSEFVYYNCNLAFTTEKDAVKLKAKGVPRMPIYYFTLLTEFDGDVDSRHFLSLLLESKK